jgi:hypothetical protein
MLRTLLRAVLIVCAALALAPRASAQDVPRTRIMSCDPNPWTITITDKVYTIGKVHILQKKTNGVIKTLKSVGDTFTIDPMEDIDIVVEQTAGKIALKLTLDNGTAKSEIRIANALTKNEPATFQVLTPNTLVWSRPEAFGHIQMGPWLVLR